MRNSVPQNGLLGDSPAQKMFQEMLDEVYAQKMAESGQLGLAKIIADQIALQGDQQDIRKALSEARSGDPFRLDTKTGPPVFLDLPQVRSRQAFIPVKSAPNPADMFPVDGLK
jgi:hypothetical protein